MVMMTTIVLKWDGVTGRRVERNVEWKKRNGPWNVEVLLFLEDPSLEVPWV